MIVVKLKENERIDDLGIKDLKIIQNTDGFCFGMDAVLLANYCDIKKSSNVIDLGTGTAVIPLILWGKKDVKKIYGIEIQKEVSEMAKRSIKLNGLEGSIEILNKDLKNVTDYLGVNKYDVVTTNPPYKIKGSGIVNPEDKKAISRHEIKCNLEDVIKTSSRLLKHKGRFFMVHRPQRLVDIVFLMRKYKIEPKKVRFVHPRVEKKPNMLLVMGIKAAKPELKFEKPLYVYNDDLTYTEEINQIYGLKGEK
ncbi:MAG: tRNA1(Val) (adenine(37)-N6)-methyltransferase [Firmicutes bacterium]|nr:tRNA1(Val) (adenine(37)-N6)-methyltransferase [Bacillota bacterium]